MSRCVSPSTAARHELALLSMFGLWQPICSLCHVSLELTVARLPVLHVHEKAVAGAQPALIQPSSLGADRNASPDDAVRLWNSPQIV